MSVGSHRVSVYRLSYRRKRQDTVVQNLRTWKEEALVMVKASRMLASRLKVKNRSAAYSTLCAVQLYC